MVSCQRLLLRRRLRAWRQLNCMQSQKLRDDVGAALWGEFHEKSLLQAVFDEARSVVGGYCCASNFGHADIAACLILRGQKAALSCMGSAAFFVWAARLAAPNHAVCGP